MVLTGRSYGFYDEGANSGSVEEIMEGRSVFSNKALGCFVC